MFATKTALESAQGNGAGSLKEWQRYTTLAVMILGGVVTLLAATQIVQQTLEHVRNQGFKQEAEAIVYQVQERVWNLVEEVDRIAARPQHLEALQSDASLEQHNRSLATEAFPGLNRLLLFPGDVYALEPKDYPELGYATLDLMFRLETGQDAPLVEVHAPGRPEARAELVRKIGDGDGYLVATYDLSRLTSQLASDAVALDLWQQVDNVTSRVMQLGDRGLSVLDREAATKLDQAPIYVAYEGVRLWTPLPFRSVIVAAVLLVFGIVLLVAGIMWRLQLAAGNSAADEALAKKPQTPTPVKGTAKPVKKQPASKAAPQKAAGAGEEPAAEQPSEPKTVAPTRAHGKVEPGLFRAYDIRGVVDRDLSEDTAEQIGHAIGSEAVDRGCQQVVVARDGRLSGPALQEALMRGIMRSGADVIDIGAVPTGVLYFATHHLETGCGVMVTGSHNPPEYNGFKIVLDGETLHGAAIKDLHDRIVSGRLDEGSGSLSRENIAEDYIEAIASDVQLEEPIKVVVDAGNGIAGELGPQVLEAVGCEVIPLYCEVDGEFPNHHPDPSEPENLTDLIQAVKDNEADLGVAFDGDGDRLGVVTPSGANIFPDRILMLLAMDVLSRNPGGTVIYDVKCTGKLAGLIVGHGGTPMMYRTGHSLIKAKMKETGAVLGGEMSGHFFIQERWYGFDDGIYSAARLLEVLAFDPRSPASALEALPEGVSTPELKVQVADGNPHGFVEKFVASAKFEGARITDIDGVRADFPDGWGLVRASNTTPILVMRFEGDDEEALTRVQELFRAQLLSIDPDLSLPF